MLAIVVGSLAVAHGAVYHRQAESQRILVPGNDAINQFGVPFPTKGPEFSAVKAQPLMKVLVDKASDKDASSVAFEGATSMMVVANVKDQTLRLIPAGQAHELSAHEVSIASAKYNNTVKRNGWAYLSISASKDVRVSREVKMYAAGFLEGFVSAQQIRDFQHNANALIGDSEEKHHAMGNIRSVFEKDAMTIVSLGGMKNGTTLTESNAPSDAWWRQARYALMQSWGMLDAYNRQVDQVKGTPMSMVDLFILNSDGETPELETAYDMEEYLLRQSQKEDGSDDDSSKQVFLQKRVQHTAGSTPRASKRGSRQELRHEELRKLNDQVWRRIKRATGRCSALVRLAQNSSDLMIGHTTFSDYSEMNRIYKYYDFPLGDGVAQGISFSSYPGVAGSTDDYYLMNTGLVVTETTISMLTDEPYDKLDDSASKVPDFMRIMLANRLAQSGQDWTRWMKQFATGTYSSQWMVVDYNKFKPGQPLRNGTLYVIEQIPGLSHIVDATAHLQKHGYWGSENRAWFKDVRDAIGATEAEEVHGPLFSADKNPRAHIFAATAPQVQTLLDMRAEMRRNRWPYEIDGGSANAPDHAISARGDLDKENPDPNGGVDAKVTNFCLAKRLQCDAISGPTHDTQKPFKWTDDKGRQLFPKVSHDGMPDSFNFDWVRMGPSGESSASEQC